MRITNTLIRTGCSFKAYRISKTHNSCLINIDNSYFGDNAYVNSAGNLTIVNSGFAPHVFIGTYKHGLNKDEADSAYKITIISTKFVGQNVSIFGNVTINPGVVIGACSVVTKDCETNGMYLGNPAKLIKKYNEVTGRYEYI